MHCLHKEILGQSFRQAIHRLKTFLQQRILIFCINIRMIQYSAASFTCNLSIENNCTSRFQLLPYIRAVIPDRLHRSIACMQHHRYNRCSAAFQQFRSFRKNHPVPALSAIVIFCILYRNRCVIGMIFSWVMLCHIPHCINADARQMTFCFCTDPFDC